MTYDASIMPQQIQNLIANLPKATDLKPFNILLVGPTGTGKTTTALKIAEVMNAELLEVKLKHGRADLSYLDRISTFGSTNSLGWIDTGDFTKRPKVVLVDEIDLVPTQGIPLRRTLDDQKSKIFFIATCNSIEKLHESVISRFQVIKVEGEDLRQKFSHNQIKALLG